MDQYLKATINNVQLKKERLSHYNPIKTDKWVNVLFVVYIGLSYFETYLTNFIGSNTKYYLLFLIFVILWKNDFKIVFDKYSLFILSWFAFKFLSMLWSDFSNDDVQIHMLSQIGIVAFFLVINARHYSGDFLRLLVKSHFFFSLLFGILSILFNESFRSEIFSSRKVLTLFGLQNDPNNCAAFLIVAIAIALYTLVFEKKYYLLNVVTIGINTFAILLTSSRAGFISLGCILLIMFFLPNRGKHRVLTRIQILILILIVLFIGYLLVVNLLPVENIERIFSFEDYEGGSGRSVRWNLAFDLIYAKPLLGWGWGGYDIGYGAIHNTVLTSLCDIGILGTSLFVVVVINIIFDSYRRKDGLAILFLICGILPAFTIDAINKRFFWNGIIMAILLVQYSKYVKQFEIWK